MVWKIDGKAKTRKERFPFLFLRKKLAKPEACVAKIAFEILEI
jgi:hypothetical protein